MNNQITNNFEICCSNQEKHSYSLIHSPKPLSLPQTMTECIERLLWYSSRSSSQFVYNEFIDDFTYEEATFNFIMRAMGIEEKDIYWSYTIPEEYIHEYQNEICIHCQKLIMKIGRHSETKTQTMLRHIRNSIAHGNFTILDDMFIGFDYGTSSECTSILKFKPIHLLNALKLLNNERVAGLGELQKINLIENAFIRLGYNVEREQKIGKHMRCDLCIEKGDLKYFIEIKENPHRFIKSDYLLPQLKRYQSLIGNHKLILIIDSSILTKEATNLLKNESIEIIDKKRIIELFLGTDIMSELNF